MTGSRAAVRYAKAVLSLAVDKKSAEAVNTELQALGSVFAENEEINLYLQNPVIKSEAKKTALMEVFPKSGEITKGLLETLVQNKRLDLLPAIVAQYSRLFDELNNKRVAVVTTAVPISADLEKKVLAKVKELTGAEAALENVVDESIIGGFILRVGDLQYNASISGRLSSLKREFTNNTYVSKL